MSIPRITLWTPAVPVPIRLHVTDFGDYRLDKQAEQIQKEGKTITVTPTAMYILSSIAGRRIVEPVRWVLLDGLRDILRGNLRTETPERQDLLASTYGEILGALILAFELGGNIEIIRLLESNQTQTPDFIILQPQGTSGRVAAHLLECKGVVLDVNNLNHSGRIDVCQHIRNFRKDGQAQLTITRLDQLRLGSRFVIGEEIPFSGVEQMASINLSIVSIPDGRIPRLLDTAVKMPNRACCNGIGKNCLQCMTDPKQPTSSNAIAVLHREQISSNRALKTGIESFIRQYKNIQRALWAEHDNEFARSIDDLLEQLRSLKLSKEVKNLFGLMVLSVLEAGLTQELENFDLGLGEVQPKRTFASPVLRSLFQEILREFQREKRYSKKEINSVSYSEMLTEILREKTRVDESAWSKKFIAQEGDIAPLRLPSDEDAGFPEPIKPTTPPLRISVVKEAFENAELIRLIANQSTAQAFRQLQRRAENIIIRLRGDYRIQWRDEFVELDTTRINLGVSWDPFPYPHQGYHRPGITAWISRDGRAEIIVRYPE